MLHAYKYVEFTFINYSQITTYTLALAIVWHDVKEMDSGLVRRTPPPKSLVFLTEYTKQRIEKFILLVALGISQHLGSYCERFYVF